VCGGVGCGSVLPIGTLVLSVRGGNVKVGDAFAIGDDWGFSTNREQKKRG
jgi:hypothetical protein